MTIGQIIKEYRDRTGSTMNDVAWLKNWHFIWQMIRRILLRMSEE